jgi:hypothetical protein
VWVSLFFVLFFLSSKNHLCKNKRCRKIWETKQAGQETVGKREWLVGRGFLPILAGVRQSKSHWHQGHPVGLTLSHPVTLPPPSLCGYSLDPVGHRLGHLGPCAHRKERQEGARDTVPPVTSGWVSSHTQGILAEACPSEFKVKWN